MKKFLLIAVAFLATIVAGATTKEVVFDFAANPWGLPLGSGQGETADAGNITAPIVVDGVSLNFDKGTASTLPRMWNNKEAGQLRVYKNNIFTVTSDGLNIVKIAFTGTVAFSVEDGTLTGTNWTGDFASIIFTGTGTSKLDKIVVTLSDEGEVVNPDPGTDPEPGVDPTPTEGTGAGTLENPYDCVAANSVASQLAADASTTKEVYIKGIVSSIKANYDTQFHNGTFYISNDGTAEGQFYVFRALYLNNEKYTEGELLEVGDEVVVCGILTNYMGNTPETVAGKAYLVSLKKGEGGSTDPEPGVDPDPSIEVGKNFVVNSDFETWTDNQPDAWKSTTTASNAKLSQSEDAYEGTYAVCVAGDEKANKRLATQEYALPAGQYKMSAFVKGEGQVRPGYAVVGEDGEIARSGYKYGEYAATSADEWTEVIYEFELAEATKVNFVIMNPKTSTYAAASDKLVDNFTVVCLSTTGINEAVNVEGEQVIYDLTGRRLAQPVKGINIINGKKVIIK